MGSGSHLKGRLLFYSTNRPAGSEEREDPAGGADGSEGRGVRPTPVKEILMGWFKNIQRTMPKFFVFFKGSLCDSTTTNIYQYQLVCAFSATTCCRQFLFQGCGIEKTYLITFAYSITLRTCRSILYPQKHASSTPILKLLNHRVIIFVFCFGHLFTPIFSKVIIPSRGAIIPSRSGSITFSQGFTWDFCGLCPIVIWGNPTESEFYLKFICGNASWHPRATPTRHLRIW